MLTVLTVAEAKEKILTTASIMQVRGNKIPLIDAVGRVLTRPFIVSDDLPLFNRSTMDGFAVMAKDTFGTTDAMPALLEIAGEVLMGQIPPVPLSPGYALRISTGGMLPDGSDAVVMVEYTELLGNKTVAIHRAVAPGENTIIRGEDMKMGETLLSAGHILRPQDVGALAALGYTEVDVSDKPRVAILSTGDELVMPDQTPKPGQIRDINSYLLAAMVKQAGGTPTLLGIIPDQADELLFALKEARAFDCIILSGGSSAGTRDHTAAAINKLGNPGVLFHGVSMRPGKPLIFGIVDDKPYFGLSGNPTSAMVGFLLFVQPLLLHLAGSREVPNLLQARVDRNLSSASGREDYFRAVLYDRDGELWARPLLGQANLISTVVRGNALLRIPQNSEGIEAGEILEAILI
ncbi:MAG: molybdopterin molybdotransferase MoeA [Clostridiales bacterium]|jgi:molybdopterin molybdotransferase|nr:molybdopterin molybdotransferase MoeA [Clostridiales bacterium]